MRILCCNFCLFYPPTEPQARLRGSGPAADIIAGGGRGLKAHSQTVASPPGSLAGSKTVTAGAAAPVTTGSSAAAAVPPMPAAKVLRVSLQLQ